MSDTIRITAVVENTAGRLGTLGEHGLSFWIEAGPHRILFDTGQGAALRHNAQRLDIDLAQAHAIVLSHGHYDHTGGLAAGLDAAGPVPVYAHSAAFDAKYACSADRTSRYIGTSAENAARVRDSAARLTATDTPTEIAPGLFVTGQVPRVTDFEDVGGPFFLDAACSRPDPMADDQALYFASAHGTVVVLGCAHAGLVNTLEYIAALTHGAPIHAVMGGMHLGAASPERLERTIDALRAYPLGLLAPAHCTGPVAVAQLWQALPGASAACSVGATFTFEAPATSGGSGSAPGQPS